MEKKTKNNCESVETREEQARNKTKKDKQQKTTINIVLVIIWRAQIKYFTLANGFHVIPFLSFTIEATDQVQTSVGIDGRGGWG